MSNKKYVYNTQKQEIDVYFGNVEIPEVTLCKFTSGYYALELNECHGAQELCL